MQTKQTLPLVHNYRPSNLSEKAPAIIMLHGYGSNEDDLFSFAPELPEKYAVIALKAPLSLQGMGNAWYTIHFQNADNTKFNDIEEARSEEHTSELQSRGHLVCRLLLEKKKKTRNTARLHNLEW